MSRCKTYNRKKAIIFMLCVFLVFIGLCIRLGYLIIFRGNYYSEKAEELHQRERSIKAARGKIYDANGVLFVAIKTPFEIGRAHV